MQVSTFKTSQKHLFFLVEHGYATIQGKIISVTRLNSQFNSSSNKALDNAAVQLDLRLLQINGVRVKHKIRLKYFAGQLNKFAIGQVWQFRVKLQKPRSFATPGSFDQEKYLFAKRISMIGSISNNRTSQAVNRLIAPNSASNFNFLNFKDKIITTTINKLNIVAERYQLKNLSIMLALSLAIKDLDFSKLTEVFQQSGILHLLTISGLHISFIGGMIFKVISFIWKTIVSVDLLEKYPAPIIAAYASLAIIVGYVDLIGFNVASFRALLMSSLYFSSILLRFILPAKQSYFLTMLIILCIDPFVVLLSGFWLSFIAAGILVYAADRKYNIKAYK